MAGTLLSPEFIASVAAAIVFGVICFAGLPRAVFVFTLLAWIPFSGFVRLRGHDIEQTLQPVELLATVLIAVWAVRRGAARRRDPLAGLPLNRALVGLVLVSCGSLMSGWLWIDPAVPQDHVKLAVSLGQILLFVWPIGIYFVVADAVVDETWVRRIEALVILLALPTLAFPFVQTSSRLTWSVSFALAASPLSFARLLDSRSWWQRPWLLVLSVSPIAAGLAAGKAFWYISATVGLLTVAWFRARVLAFVLAPLMACVIVIGSYLAFDDPVPFVQPIVASEIAQQSIGGRFGRERLAADALRIWTRYPLFGVGPGNAWPYMRTYSTLDTPHNQFLNVLVELGAAGAACLVLFVVRAWRTGSALARQLHTPFRRTFALGWLGLFVGLVAGGITGDVIFPSIRNSGIDTFAFAYPQWVMLGLVVSLARIDIRERPLASRPVVPVE